MPSALDVPRLREQFPALARTVRGRPAVYLDGPAGSQVPRRVVAAVSRYLLETNANHGGLFATSDESDGILDNAHQAVADFLGVSDRDEVVFGPNMTSLTFALSRSLGRTWQSGDEVLVTRLDHDANVTPWVLAARDAGATVRHVGLRADDCTLDWDDFESKLSDRTKLVAVGYASNATGTINPVGRIVRKAHRVGASVFVDAVHYAPHRLIDVAELHCDFLVCSAYKFFGPHVGILWGKRELLESLPAYKVRPASDELPGRWMTGTQNHEGIAGAAEAIEYLADVGRAVSPQCTGRRGALAAAYLSIRQHEQQLAERLLAGLVQLPGLRIWGITDAKRFEDRVPTVSLTHADRTPQEMAKFLGQEGFFVWAGHHYAVPFTEAMGLEPHGTLRIGLLHYNTIDDVDRLLASLEAFFRR